MDHMLSESKFTELMRRIEVALELNIRNMPSVLLSNSREIVLDIIHAKVIFPYSQMNHALSYLNPYFDSGVRHLIMHSCTPGMVYVDVGANIGALASVAAKCLGSTGKIITIEPIREHAEYISRNIFLNSPEVTHEHHACVVAGREGSLSLNVIPGDTRSATLFPYTSRTHPQNEIIEVRVARLSDLIPASQDPLFIKIDAEGAEHEILNDIFSHPECLAARRTLILFEYGTDHNVRAGHGGSDVLELLESHGLQGRFVQPSSGVVTEVLTRQTMNQDGNVLVVVENSHF